MYIGHEGSNKLPWLCLKKFSNLSKLCAIQLYTYLIYVPSNASVNRQAVCMIRDLTVIPTLLAKPHTVLE